MPTDIVDGPLGLEAVHRFNGFFEMNDLAVAFGSPRIKLDTIEGLHDLPEHDDNRDPRTARLGEIVYPGFPRGKTIVYTGRLQCASQQELANLRQFMRFTFKQAMNQELLMEIIPHASYGDDVWAYRAEVASNGLKIDDHIITNGRSVWRYQREFTLTLRLSDPRFFLYSGFVDLDGFAAASTHTLNNSGDAEADPTFVVSVPLGLPDVTLTNADVLDPSGDPVVLTFRDVIAGDLIVDFSSRRAQVAPVIDPTLREEAYEDTAASTWWDEFIPGLNPGDNDVTVSHGWAVAYYPRSW